MKHAFQCAALGAVATLMLATPAAAQVVYNTSLPDHDGATYQTNTDATGTRTVSTGNRTTAPAPSESWFQANVGGNGTVGITTDYARGGNGSAYFATQGNAAKGDLQYNFNGLTTLASFSALSFDFYRDPASDVAPGFAPVLRLNIFEDDGASLRFAGSLVSEFIYQNQTNPTEGVWTTISSTQTSGIWWATNGLLGPTFANANGGQKTLSEWIAGNAGSTLYVGGYNIGVGSGWGDGSFSGGVDNLTFSSARGQEAFNFEVAATAAVPEPGTWALLILGFGAVGGAMRRRTGTVVRTRATCRFA